MLVLVNSGQIPVIRLNLVDHPLHFAPVLLTQGFLIGLAQRGLRQGLDKIHLFRRLYRALLVFHQLDHPCDNCLMKAAMRTGQIQQCELAGPNGRSFEQAYTPVKDFDGSEKAILLFRDVTEKRASLAAQILVPASSTESPLSRNSCRMRPLS